MPIERYKSFRTYFNCTDLPEEYTPTNSAMTRLIDSCLKKTSMETLFAFKFGLIDVPAPSYDGFLGDDESLIPARHSASEVLVDPRSMDVDILTGINAVEGFAFEGYFSTSISFWSKFNLSDEVIVTIERYSLVLKDKCRQNALIANRAKFQKYYDERVRQMIPDAKDLNSEKARRLKAIIVNSDIIFDSGFAGLIHKLLHQRRNLETLRKQMPNTHDDNDKSHERREKTFFVYEYLHESGMVSFDDYKKILNSNFKMSTHFDGIDFAFGNIVLKIFDLFN
jgi:hypothetical protein